MRPPTLARRQASRQSVSSLISKVHPEHEYRQNAATPKGEANSQIWSFLFSVECNQHTCGMSYPCGRISVPHGSRVVEHTSLLPGILDAPVSLPRSANR